MDLNKTQFAKHLNEFANSHISPDDLTEMDDDHPSMKAFTPSGLPVRAFERGDVAMGHCIGAACNLNRHLEAQGVAPRKITYGGPRGFYSRFDTRPVRHDVTEVDVEGAPMVVDFTHRQFDEKADFPLVEPRAEFDKRMRRHGFKAGEVQYPGEGNW